MPNVGEGNGTPLQYSCLENPMDGGAWWAAVHGVARSRTWLSAFTFTFHFHALEKEMATHSSVLAWRIPGTGEPGGVPSMGLHRVGHDWSDLAAAVAAMPNVTVFGDEAFKEVIKVNWHHKGGPWCDETDVLTGSRDTIYSQTERTDLWFSWGRGIGEREIGSLGLAGANC